MKLKIAWGALEVWTLSGHWIGLALSSSSSSWLSWLDSGRWGVGIQTTATSLPTSCNSMKSKRSKTWWRHSDVCDLPLTSAVRLCVPPNLQQAKANILIDNWAKYFYQRTPGRSERDWVHAVCGRVADCMTGVGTMGNNLPHRDNPPPSHCSRLLPSLPTLLHQPTVHSSPSLLCHSCSPAPPCYPLHRV